MPIVIKPRTLGLLSKCERRPPRASLVDRIEANPIEELEQPRLLRRKNRILEELVRDRQRPADELVEVMP